MKLPITLAALALFTASAPAAIIITAPTSTTEGSIQITSDITFTLTSFATFGNIYLILDELAPSDSTPTTATLDSTPTVVTSPDPLPSSVMTVTFCDNWTLNSGDPTENDGVIKFGNSSFLALSPGSTFTINAGTFILPATSDFNPLVSGTFEGPMFLVANMSGLRISDTVPEPSTAMFSAGVLAMTLLRRRK